MNITPEEVQRIAQLSRLELTDKEVSAATAHLSGILEHFSHIQEIDTEQTPTADDASGLLNITRTDEADAECLCAAADLLERAPSILNGHVKVQAAL